MITFFFHGRLANGGAMHEHRLIRFADEGAAERASGHKESTEKANKLKGLLDVIDSDASLQKRWESIMADGDAEMREVEDYRNAVVAKIMKLDKEAKTGDGKNIRENIDEWQKYLPQTRQDMINIGLATGIISVDSLSALNGARQGGRKEKVTAGAEYSEDVEALSQRYRDLVEEEKNDGWNRERSLERNRVLQQLRRIDPQMSSTLHASLRGEIPVRDMHGRTGSEARAELSRSTRGYGRRDAARERREMSSEDLYQDPAFRRAIASRPGGGATLERLGEEDRRGRSHKLMLDALGIDGNDDASPRYDSRGFNTRAMSQGRYAPRSAQSYAGSYNRDAYPSPNFRPFGNGEGERYMAKQDEIKGRFANQHSEEITRGLNEGRYEKYKDDPAYASIMRAFRNAESQWSSNPDRRYGDLKWFQSQIGELEKRYQHRELMSETLGKAKERGEVLGTYDVRREYGYGPEVRVGMQYMASDGTMRSFNYSPYYETGQPMGANLTEWEDFLDATGIVIEKDFYRSATYNTMSYSRPRVKGLHFTFTKPGRYVIDGQPVAVNGRQNGAPRQRNDSVLVHLASYNPVQSRAGAAEGNVSPEEVPDLEGIKPVRLDVRSQSTWTPTRPGSFRIYRDGNMRNNESEEISLLFLKTDGSTMQSNSGIIVKRLDNGVFDLYFTESGKYKIMHRHGIGGNYGSSGRENLVLDAEVKRVKKTTPRPRPVEPPPVQPSPEPVPTPEPVPPAVEPVPTPPPVESTPPVPKIETETEKTERNRITRLIDDARDLLQKDEFEKTVEFVTKNEKDLKGTEDYFEMLISAQSRINPRKCLDLCQEYRKAFKDNDRSIFLHALTIGGASLNIASQDELNFAEQYFINKIATAWDQFQAQRTWGEYVQQIHQKSEANMLKVQTQAAPAEKSVPRSAPAAKPAPAKKPAPKPAKPEAPAAKAAEKSERPVGKPLEERHRDALQSILKQSSLLDDFLGKLDKVSGTWSEQERKSIVEPVRKLRQAIESATKAPVNEASLKNILELDRQCTQLWSALNRFADTAGGAKPGAKSADKPAPKPAPAPATPAQKKKSAEKPAVKKSPSVVPPSVAKIAPKAPLKNPVEAFSFGPIDGPVSSRELKFNEKEWLNFQIRVTEAEAALKTMQDAVKKKVAPSSGEVEQWLGVLKKVKAGEGAAEAQRLAEKGNRDAKKYLASVKNLETEFTKLQKTASAKPETPEKKT